ncbi:MFS transporter [Yinghuangia sp. ASG 101]|uniref:MFS transporter n=1 Tax=Yinghuangia sp. ASG 101 TaxID=2896848 RepID=UPI001E389D8A|nr:MFS transporter [Yinghuangia sp. ASG 101]UGQ13666.1 MFS transporter [Yinghuangia sp. ASG 101]
MATAPRGAATQHHGHDPGAGRTGVIVGVLAFCGIVVSLMQTLVVPLLTELPDLLDTSASNASWVVTSTLLAGAVSTPVMGRLGDMYGKRRILLLCLAVLTLGAVICALSNSLLPMLIGRVLQGASFGVIALGMSLMRDALPPARLGPSVALMSATLGIGGAVGLPVAALVAQSADWHALFWGTAALGAIDVVLVLLLVPESGVRAPARFDVLGTIGLSAGLLALLLAISKGADWGWTSGVTLGLFAATLVILPLWGLGELRTPHPLVDLRVSAQPQVLFTNLASVVVGFSMYAQALVIPQLLMLPEGSGYGLGRSMVVAGLVMAPSGLVMMVVSPLSAKLSAAYGPKASLFLGSLLTALGYVLAVFMLDAVWKIIIAVCVSAAGTALAYAAMPALIMQAVPARQTGAATGLNTLMRSIGTSTSAAVTSMILAGMTTTYNGSAIPSLGGLKAGLWVGCAAAVAAALVTTLIPGRRPTASHGPADDAPVLAPKPETSTSPA